MKPSELAAAIEEAEENNDPVGGDLLCDNAAMIVRVLRHHEALVKALRGVINGKCTFQGAEQLLATIEREGRS